MNLGARARDVISSARRIAVARWLPTHGAGERASSPRPLSLKGIAANEHLLPGRVSRLPLLSEACVTPIHPRQRMVVCRGRDPWRPRAWPVNQE